HDAYQTMWEGYLKDRIGPLLDKRPKAFLSIGLVLTIWAASGGMAMTINAMDKCYDLEKQRPYYRVRLLAILLTMVVSTLLLIGAEINSEIDFVAYNVKPGCRDFRGKPWEYEKLSAAMETESASTG